MSKALRPLAGLDITRPAPARIYDYMLNGRHHFDTDAQAAERILAVVPEIRDCAWSNRGFHQRAAAWIARQGVKQFLDIGSGLPTVGNTHDVVQKIHPDACVVYVDNDPLVELHSQGILDGSGRVRVLCADLREPGSILDHPVVRELIDPALPTGLLMTAVLMFVSDAADPWRLVDVYLRAMRSGSYLSLSHLTDDAKPPLAVDAFHRVFDRATEQMHFRSKAQVARFFDGLEIVPPYAGAAPALTYCGLWGAEDVQLADSDGSRWLYCAVAKRPLSRIKLHLEDVIKPTPEELGIDPAGLAWERSGDDDGSIEIAFPLSRQWTRGDWVLMRVAGDQARRVLVFDRNEWECFIDGARKGEFDDAADTASSPGHLMS
jgi:S-adenosyl methyltransferase